MSKNFDCVCGNMDILMYNNTVKKIKDVKKGDVVYSVQFSGDGYRYVKGEVTGLNRRKGKAVKITLADGRRLICSPNHQWLTQSGWHFTYDDETLSPGKVYLKEDTKMFGFTGKIPKIVTETKHYMEGYFLGAEVFGKNLVGFKGGEMAEFVLQNAETTTRMYNYLLYLGADVTLEDCFAHDKVTNEYYVTKKMNISYKDLLALSVKYGKNLEKEEFLRGFVAGAYDSDGTANPIVKNVNTSKKEYLEIVKNGVELFGFEFSYDSKKRMATLLGGPSELLRFYNIYNPITSYKLENVDITHLHKERIKVASIEEVKCDELVELTVSSRSFIANGIVSHNCTTGMVKEV